MNSKTHISEELLVDFALGNTSDELREDIMEHLIVCEQCQRQFDEWYQIVSETTNETVTTELKERIWESVQGQHQQRKLTKKITKHRLLVGVTTAAAIFVILIGALVTYQSNLSGYEVAINDEIKGKMIQNNPTTQQLPVIPITAYQDISDNLWLNDDSKELLLEVNGLTHISNHDYQLWIIYENNEIKGEVLTTVDGGARVWFKGNDVNQFKFIKGSVEPLGGSLKPTGPETFIVPLKEKGGF